MHSSRMRTARSSSHRGGVCLSACWDRHPTGVVLETPPGVSLETPLGVDLRYPQLPPWVWAWRPPTQIPLNFPTGCGPGNLQGMLGYHPPPPETCCKVCWYTTCNAYWDSTPPCGQNDRHV